MAPPKNPTKTADKASAPQYTSLQGLVWPEQGICTERELYVRLHHGVGLAESKGELVFGTGGVAQFNTYFNLFNFGKWQKYCDLSDIHLALTGKGRFEVTAFAAFEGRSWERVLNEVTDLKGDKTPQRFDLSHSADIGRPGLLFFEVKALSQATLTSAEWQTAQAPRRTPDLALSITTFRREASVRRSVARFERFIKTSPLKDHIHLIVVDNGQTANLTPSSHVTPIDNENLGGAGGFARGLIEARARGASHCLFMDDDASVHMAAFERTWMFLAYAIDAKTAIAGAMSVSEHRWRIWENGAVFDGLCQGLWRDTDLRDSGQVFHMELATIADPPDNMYGGWWYFAFAVDEVEYMPFPFFVRGDDVSFSLAHDFNIVTLPGVISFQDEDFTNKESPQTLYLDLRSHMAHFLSLPQMQANKWRTLRIATWFILRSLMRSHYASAEALNLAFEDVMRGPAFFADNADMAERRGLIKTFTGDGNWQTYNADAQPPDRRWFNPHRRLTRVFMQLMLNGYLLPLFRLYGNRITVEAPDRLSTRITWGAARITYLDATRTKAYTVTHSKRRGWAGMWRLALNSVRFLRQYKQVQKDWQEGYGQLASETFWHDKLGTGDKAAANSL